jgi:Homing endonuclease associated repeat
VPRYSDAQILAELAACAERLGRSPTMRELADDPEASLHPQTAVERFGSWNAAKRRAGLVPRRFATDDELLRQLRELGDRLGRTPTGRDLHERRKELPSTSLYWHRFGSFSNALRAAGFPVQGREERRERALADGERLARRLKRAPTLADWRRERAEASPALLSEWQVYRLFAEDGAGWGAFRAAVSARLAELEPE